MTGIGALCNHSSYDGPNAQNIKLIPSFPLQPFTNRLFVNKLQINLQQDMNGIGEAFPNLQLLNIEGNAGSTMASIERRHFENMNNLRALAFTYAENTKVIAEFAFTELTNVEFIGFRETGISHLPENVFWNLRRLKALISYGNPFTSIDEDLFRDLVQLEVLWLRNCDFNHLRKNSFSNLRMLESLDLSYSPISIMDSEVFRNLINLKDLNMEGCRLINLPENLFETNSKLKSINLSYNRLKKIGVNFSMLRMLKTVFLQGNGCIDNSYSVDLEYSVESTAELDSIVKQKCK